MIKYIFSVLILILITGCASQNSQSTEDIYSKIISKGSSVKLDSNQRQSIVVEKVIDGTKLFEQGKYAESVIEFQEALLYDTTHSIYYAMAKSYMKLNKYRLAQNHIEMSLDLKPRFIPSYEILAELLIYNDDVNQAEQVMKKIIDLEPSVSNKFKLARFYEFFDKTDEAITFYNDILEDQSDNQKVLSRLYRIYSRVDSTKAISTLKKLLKIEPNNKQYLMDLLSVYQSSNNYKKADELLGRLEVLMNRSEIIRQYVIFGNQIIEDTTQKSREYTKDFLRKLDSKYFTNWRIQLLKGHLNLKLKNFNEAAKNFETTYNLNDSLITDPADIGRIFQINEQYSLAVDFYKRSLKQNPENENVQYFTSYAYFMNEQKDSALYFAKKLLESDSASVPYLVHTGMIYNELDSLEKAEMYYKKAYKINRLDPLLNNNYAYLLTQMNKDLDKALKMSKIAIEKQPDNSAYLDTYGWILYKMGKYEEALEYIEKATKKEQPGAEVFEHLGDIYIKLNNIDKAIQAYKKGLELDPERTELNDKIRKYING